MELIKDSSSPWVLVGGQKVNGSFSWVDGTPWEYQRWAPRRPDNNWGNEDCMNIYANGDYGNGLKSLWNDINCNGTGIINGNRPYVCSKSMGI